MTSSPQLPKVVIVGGGTAGWMTAAVFARMYDAGSIDVTLIESDQIGTVGVGEATIPNIVEFNRMLGIDEADFMAKTDATFKLGIEFTNWGNKGDSYLHPFGQVGVDMEGIYFHHYWNKMRQNGDKSNFQEYSLAAVAGKLGKFMHPKSDPKSPLSQMSYAYHFDATLYAAYLRKYSGTKGIKRVEGIINTASQHPTTGDIASLHLKDGTVITGDIFIDCSGFKGLLIGETLDVAYKDWSHWLPCNSALAVPSEKGADLPAYTKATAHTAGWQWKIPTQSRVGNGHVYCSDYISDDEATHQLLNGLDSSPLKDPRPIRFTTGHREKFWYKNCISIGLSSGFLEPLESTSIYLIQAGVSRLMALFPNGPIQDADRDEYNRLMTLEFEQVRDFIILHYNATDRKEHFWQDRKHMPIPDSLTRKIDLFKGTGRFFRYEGDLFTLASWASVFIGQNIIPATYDPIVATMPNDKIKASLTSMHQGIAGFAHKMPDHQTYINRYCPSAKSAALKI